MRKPTELKVAANIIRRVLEAAERGDTALLGQILQATKRKSSEGKISSSKEIATSKEVVEYGRYGSKFTEKELMNEIEKFDDIDRLSEYLRNKYVTRSDIDAVARAVHLPSTKGMDYEGVVRRVVDATLGYKIRSKAVRGSSIERSSKDG